MVSYGEELIAPHPTPSWRIAPCRLPATACSVVSQFTSITGGLILLPHRKEAPCCGDSYQHITKKNSEDTSSVLKSQSLYFLNRSWDKQNRNTFSLALMFPKYDIVLFHFLQNCFRGYHE